MNKTDLIKNTAKIAGITQKNAAVVVNAVFESITGALAAGDKIQIAGFGTFEVKQRNARTGINPRTKEKIEVPAFKAPAFKPAKELKDQVK